MKIEIGDRVTIKIERPKYEVVEEKKELLTEEEKEFLQNIIKYFWGVRKVRFNTQNIDFIRNNNTVLCSIDYPNLLEFYSVEYKEYKLEKLGLEGI